MNPLTVFQRSFVPYFLAMLVLIAVFGCGPTQTRPTPTYVFVIDYSGSTSVDRKQQLGQMLAELESAPEDTNVVIYRMGSETEEVFSGPLGDSGTDAIVGTVKRDLIRSDHAKGTNFAKMAVALATFSKGFCGKSYRLRIMTDGGNDFTDSKSMQAYHRATSVISLDTRLSSVIFYGVQPQFRQELRDAFAAAGPKLQILSQEQTIDE